jgi:CDP-diacylglycerol--glycerol-3-phosphate 3-phosphatidyltransferase
MATSLGERRVSAAAHLPERFWNLPNTITVLRTAVIPVLVAFPLFDGRTGSHVVAWLFIVAALGDLVDGWAARRGQQVTKIGKLLDPLADKLTVAAALVVLLAIDRIPVWGVVLVVVVIGRELAVTGLRGIASAGGRVVAAAPAGKLKALFQNVAVGCLLFPDRTLGLDNHAIGVTLLAFATVLTLWSGYGYFADYFGNGPPSGDGPQESGG